MAEAIDLKRMRMVVEVARTEAVTTAAETLGITQPAVSRGIAEIEAALGVRVFERLPRGIRLTGAGHRFVARARRLLTEVEDLVSEVREYRGGVTGRVRIGITTAGGHASWLLPRFARANPDVAVEMESGTPQALCPRLLHGEIDLILGTANYLRRWRDLSVTVLAPLHFACLFRRDHPLAAKKRPAEVDVLQYPVVYDGNVEPPYSDLAQRFAHHGLPRFQPTYVTDNFELARRFVQRTDAFFPLMWSDASFGDLGKEFLLLRGIVEIPQHHLGVAQVAQRQPSPAAAALVALLAERFAAMQSPKRDVTRRRRRS